MIKYSDLKKGDFVIANNDGDKQQGEVTDLNGDEKQICVNTGAQGFWYEPEQLEAIPLSESQLADLQFHKQVNEDGSVKFSKGDFRMLVPAGGDFSRFEIWYRDEKRQIMQPIYVHNLQNHFYEMTKVHLNSESFDVKEV